jgi:hypothetical protein
MDTRINRVARSLTRATSFQYLIIIDSLGLSPLSNQAWSLCLMRKSIVKIEITKKMYER